MRALPLLLLAVLAACAQYPTVPPPQPPEPPSGPLTQVWAVPLADPNYNLAYGSAVGPDGTLYVLTDAQVNADWSQNYAVLFAVNPDGTYRSVNLLDDGLRQAIQARGYTPCRAMVFPREGVAASGDGVYAALQFPKDPQDCPNLIALPRYNALIRLDAATLTPTHYQILDGTEPPLNGDPTWSDLQINLAAAPGGGAHLAGTHIKNVWTETGSPPLLGRLEGDGTLTLLDTEASNHPDGSFWMAQAAPDGGFYGIFTIQSDWYLVRVAPDGAFRWQLLLADGDPNTCGTCLTPGQITVDGETVYLAFTSNAPAVLGQPFPQGLDPNVEAPFAARIDAGQVTWARWLHDIYNTNSDPGIAYDPARDEVYVSIGTHIAALDPGDGATRWAVFTNEINPDRIKHQVQRYTALYILWGDLVAVGQARPVDDPNFDPENPKQGDDDTFVVRWKRN